MAELQIKKNASEAFNLGDYSKAFSTLWELGVNDFLEFSQKEDIRNKKYNWLTINWKYKNRKAYSYFWNTFILQENVFLDCFTSQRPAELLHNYYSKTNVFNKAFEIKLAKEYPNIFVEAIIKNEVFFKENRIAFLLEEIELPSALEIHQDVWESFYKGELELWKKIESTIVEIEEYSLERILFFTVAYFEANNFDANFDIHNQSILAHVYSFFIDLILRNPNIKEDNLNSSQFAMNFSMTLFKNEDHKLKTTIFKCLNLIKERQTLNSRLFQPYCFNSNFEPKYIYESLYLYESPESQYQWNVDEMRYKVNEFVYNERGRIIVESQLENGGVIPSNKQSDYHNNKILACYSQAIDQILKDLRLTHFYLKDSTNKNTKVEAVKLIKPLLVYAFNRNVRYSEVLKNTKNKIGSSINNWKEALSYVVLTNKENFQLPFIYNTKEEYLELNCKADKDFELETSSQVLSQFGFRKFKLTKFNRFNIKYSVIDTPFILLGNYIFSPILFFTSFSSQNVYVNSLINNNNSNNRQTAIEIEKVLEHLLVKQGFEVKYPTKKEVNSIDGDADLIISDKDNVLLIQLKRTKFHLNDKARYNEYINTDLKAANQLNNAEKYLNKENDVFKIKNRKVTKWIISNSFERVNTKVNDCLKVNYLDIVNVLKNDEGLIFNTLLNFISFFEDDNYFESIAKTLIEENDIFRKMFSLTNMNYRNLLWKDFDSVKEKKYRHYFNKGIELSSNQNNKGAIKALNECLKLETEDFEVHSAIANVCADLKNYEKAFFHFKKALEIIPDEPLVKMNYSFALRESGNSISLKIYSEIVKAYPFLNLKE
jgi:hypothetical protein